MERILDDDESSRKAKEIYSRRNGINIEINKKKYFSIYKFLFQFIVLLNLSIAFILYSNRNFVFSDEFLNRVNDFYNMNISQNINRFFTEEKIEETNAEKEEVNLQNTSEEVKKEKEESESYSFIKPIDGTITSFFGNRNSNNPNVSKYHTGIDISAEENTSINAAISGLVVLVSEKGNYGKHLKIQNEDIITLYAHCNSICVNEGDWIVQGQEIAKVGSTGNSTGPHLHFEIRCKDELLNPLDYINF